MDVLCASSDASLIFSPPAKYHRNNNIGRAAILSSYSSNAIDVALSRNLATLMQGDGNDSPPTEPGGNESNKSDSDRATDDLPLSMPEMDGRASRNLPTPVSSTPLASGSRKRKNYTPSRSGCASAASHGSSDGDEDTEACIIPSSQRFISCSQAVREAVAAREMTGPGKGRRVSETQPAKHVTTAQRESSDMHSVSMDFGSIAYGRVSSTQESSEETIRARHIGPHKGKYTGNTRPKTSRPMAEGSGADNVIASSSDLSLPNIRPSTSNLTRTGCPDSTDKSLLRDDSFEDAVEELSFSEFSTEKVQDDSAPFSETLRASQTNLDTSSSTDPELVVRPEPKPIIRAKERLAKSQRGYKDLPSGHPPLHRRYAVDYKPKEMAKPCRAYGTSTDSDDVSCWPDIKKKRRIVGKQSLFCKDKVCNTSKIDFHLG